MRGGKHLRLLRVQVARRRALAPVFGAVFSGKWKAGKDFCGGLNVVAAGAAAHGCAPLLRHGGLKAQDADLPFLDEPIAGVWLGNELRVGLACAAA